MTQPNELLDIVATIRPALQSTTTTPAQRAQLVYDLVLEVYEHVKFDLYGTDVDAAERNRLGDVLNAALPPTSRDLRREAGETV